MLNDMFSPYGDRNCGYDWEEAPLARLFGACFYKVKQLNNKIKGFFRERAELRRQENERIRANMLKIIRDLFKHKYLASRCKIVAYPKDKFNDKINHLRHLELLNPGLCFWFSPTRNVTFQERAAIAAFGKKEWEDMRRTLDMLSPESILRKKNV